MSEVAYTQGMLHLVQIIAYLSLADPCVGHRFVSEAPVLSPLVPDCLEFQTVAYLQFLKINNKLSKKVK